MRGRDWSNVTLVTEQVDSLIKLIRGATNIRKDVQDQAYNVKLVLAVAEKLWANMARSVKAIEEEMESLRNCQEILADELHSFTRCSESEGMEANLIELREANKRLMAENDNLKSAITRPRSRSLCKQRPRH